VKVLFCGLGSIGQRHLRNVRALYGDSVEIIAWRNRGTSPVLNADMTVREGATIEDTYGVRSFRTLDEALHEKPDVAFITSPNRLHLDTAVAAARAGCHLFIEKPISDSMEGVSELGDLVREKKLVAFVAYQFRFHPGLQHVKQLIDSGKLGNIAAAHVVNAEHLPDWHPYEDYRETHPARRDLGGGCLRIQTHEFDYALWLFGMPTRVFAVGGHLSDLEVNVEDSVSVLLACTQDKGSYPVHIHLDYLQRPPQRVCEVVGDRGKARYDYYSSTVTFYDLKERTEDVFHFGDFDRNEMFLGELRHFFACVAGKGRPLIDFDEGIRSMQIAHAADESIRTGQAVAL
jgi:predicted dehydrogenase